MAQTFDRKILRSLQDNGVREIRAYEVVSKRLTIFQTDRGTFKYSDGLYRLVAPRQELWRNCTTGFISEEKYHFYKK
ncbi:hypothetical protein [Lactococcus lactis]|uniref:hypothetical protein n=1 Tax=Lactococcus lactis TaxID=1358 RepID=UPI0022B860E5|nr:hypothetical protein [Lactococcus lactis]MCZ8492125.1 hypothetical protein [Lactococcus lactis]